ncbi:MAG TPA: M20/M25/M40 family metallo-hydrolase [Gemmatimonadaceae bacterium]|nr:M20/M25/M40 family metallo-hydrolase [Gemmatimonadaceae bacterium]
MTLDAPVGRGRPGVRLAANWLGLGLLAWAAILYTNQLPTPEPAYSDPRDFSAQRAMGIVQQMTLHVHPTGSMGNTYVRGYLLDELRALGLDGTVQSTTAIGTRYPASGRVHNVVARLGGTQPGGKAVLLMAHYDAVPAAPGAGDDASGVATVLEVLRVLKAGRPLTHDVIALFTDGEEAGLLGAAAFVREHPWSKDVGVVMNFEGRGTHGPSLMFETGPGNLDVVRVLRGVRAGARATSLSTAVYRRLPNDTDLSEFAALGLPAMNFAFIGGVDRYHTAQDDQRYLDPSSIQHEGNQALALTRAFANGPLPRPKTSDAVFFNFPGIGLVAYPASAAIVVALLAALVAVAAVYGNRRALRGAGSVAVGAALTIVAVLLSAGAAYAVGAGLQRLHAMMRTGTPELSPVYGLAVVLCAIAVTVAVFALASRRLGVATIHAGALVAWTVITLAVSVAAPGASFVFAWPLLATASASLLGFETMSGRAAGWVAVAVAVFIVAPIVYLMAFVALGVNQVGGAVIGVFVSVAAALHARLFLTNDGSMRWFSATLAAGTAAVLLAIGAATVRTNDNHPAGASLAYVIDADSAGAWLSGYGNSGTARATVRHFVQQVAAATPGRPQASPPDWVRRGFAQAGVAPVQRLDLPRSEATVLSDSTVGTERRVALRVRPAPGVHTMIVSAESGSVLRATVDSKPVRTDRYRSRQTAQRWSLSYIAPPDSGFHLGLVLPAHSQASLAIMTRSEGIPPLKLPPRPPGIVPFQMGNTTWTHHRLRL